MATGFWGVDSVTAATAMIGGQQYPTYTANYWPGQLKFWGRYFGNSPGRYGGGNQTNMRAETDALLLPGFHFLVPICSPGSAKISANDYALGGSEAQVATTDIQAAINAGRMELPNTPNHGVYLYLDIEYGGASQPLNQNFWNGFYDACRNSFITSPTYGTWQPIYPAAYANPNDTITIGVLKSDVNRTAFGLWTDQPSESVGGCAFCTAPGPDFASAQGSVGLTLHMWQYGLAGLCAGCSANRPNVDLDQTNPSFTQTNYMLWLA